MANLFGSSGQDTELPQNELGAADELLQQQAKSWTWMALAFAVIWPWGWLYFAFTYDAGKPLAVLAAIIMHAGLALLWVGRRRGDRRLWWGGVACYPVAVAVCLALKEVV